MKRDLKIRCIYECRCDERLQTKTKEFTHLAYTGLVVELEHLKIKTRLTNEKFASVKGECVTECVTSQKLIFFLQISFFTKSRARNHGASGIDIVLSVSTAPRIS
jgi:hypothetical protein